MESPTLWKFSSTQLPFIENTSTKNQGNFLCITEFEPSLRILAKISQITCLRPLAPIFSHLLWQVFPLTVNAVVENTNAKHYATSCRINTRHIPYAQHWQKWILGPGVQHHSSYTRLKKTIHTKATVQLFITLMYRVRHEMIHIWTTEGKTKNEIRMLFLNEWCTNNFKDLEVAIQIW